MKRILWLGFVLLILFYAVMLVVHVPNIIPSDFWRGVYYPFGIVGTCFYCLVAGAIFWFEVLKKP